MHTIRAQNIHEAFFKGITLIHKRGEEISPRGLRTLEVDGPVVTIYEQPWKHVLVSPERDINPFFHFFESLWILAGRGDLTFLEQFNSRMREYSDDGKSFNAPYGYRWRKHFGKDQLDEIVDLLKKEPDTRRAVLQTWDCMKDLNISSKDIPCNDMVFFKIRNGLLHISVHCRSNDMLWGAYGTNVVQFSMLQEYIAARVGIGVGFYYQWSDSFHVYPDTDTWKNVQHLKWDPNNVSTYLYPWSFYSLVSQPKYFDEDLHRFLIDPDEELGQMFPERRYGYDNKIFNEVAYPLWQAWKHHKIDKSGWVFANRCVAGDWRQAALDWLEKRGDKKT